jgi:predicted alpha/beta hydrolase family esterase
MKQALILQAWHAKLDSNWYPWLKKELEKLGYEIFLPELPGIYTETLDLSTILRSVNNLLTFDRETIVIGHSVGSVIGMRLAEQHAFDKLFLLAAWDYNDHHKGRESFWLQPIHHALIKKNVNHIYVMTSDNDPYDSAEFNKEMADRFGADYILVKGAGHFTEKFGVTKIPQILAHV